MASNESTSLPHVGDIGAHSELVCSIGGIVLAVAAELPQCMACAAARPEPDPRSKHSQQIRRNRKNACTRWRDPLEYPRRGNGPVHGWILSRDWCGPRRQIVWLDPGPAAVAFHVPQSPAARQRLRFLTSRVGEWGNERPHLYLLLSAFARRTNPLAAVPLITQ
jgi:hypothetical protein